MASTRLLLEGPDIEDLLARVREEHGPGVRIVQADKLRSGGVGGFFAREKFAVTIELPENTAGPADVRAVDQPGTLLELADAIDAAEAAEANVTMSTAGMSAPAWGTGRPPAPSALNGGPGPISTERPDFAQVLAGLAQATRPNPRTVVAAGETDLFVPATIVKVAAPPAQPPRLTTSDDETTTAATTYTAVGGRRRATRSHSDRHGAGSAAASNPLVRSLLALGLPVEMARQLETVGVATLHESLVRVLDDRPLPPVTDLQAGDVLVIAGAGVAAYDVACEVARRLRLDPADVLLAASSDLGVRIDRGARVSGAVDARRRSGLLRRADVPTIVAVDAPCDGESAAWARSIADALGARVTWAVVEATSKPADLLDHLTALGRLDGLVVRGTGASRDPASVLQPAIELALPTVLVDGRPGDGEAWAELLIDRIGELG